MTRLLNRKLKRLKRRFMRRYPKVIRSRLMRMRRSF